MMKRKVPVDRAIDILRGYCSKVPTCGKCRFSTDGQCPFMQETPPCDWDMNSNRRRFINNWSKAQPGGGSDAT